MWLTDVLDRNRLRHPDGIALRDRRREVTWAELHTEVGAFAGELARAVPAGSRVVVLSGNRLEMIETYLACAAAGVIAVPANPALTAPELAGILEGVEPALAVADEAGRDRLAREHPGLKTMPIELVPQMAAAQGRSAQPADSPPRPGSLTASFAIMHTSATTGRPKGVVVDQRSVQLKALSWLAEVHCGPDTVFLDACPLFHGSVVNALAYLGAGATLCVLDEFTPQACLSALERWRVQHVLLVPSMVRLLLEARALATTDLSALDLVVHAAAPMPAELAERAAAALGAGLMAVYGITEGGGPSLALEPAERPGPAPVPGAACVGLPMLGVSARIARDDGSQAEAGEIGELWLGGDGLMLRYWRDPRATAEVVQDGWLRTRDLGCRDAAGLIWLVDRRNDLILRGGQNVYPAEIEAVLRDSPQVADAAVVPVPSAVWGQAPFAFVQPSAPGAFDEAALLALCVARLASYKRPVRFVAVDSIARSPAGKILRGRLREQAEALSAPAGGQSATDSPSDSPSDGPSASPSAPTRTAGP
ncbi:acyl-CoA synthetase (AMP-forming)/AMP-acid ligase II [Catenulispora sp. GP43]|uniref:class I adenylate-forming enzyme family protein n=1 Tax=Catenulispora sp. GP43 TaxID=3156263 RepID=UPI003511D63A